MLKQTVTLMMAGTFALAANGMFLNINDKDLEVGGEIDISKYSSQITTNSYMVGATFFKSDEFDNMVSAHFGVKNNLTSMPRLKVGLGVKAVYTSGHGEDFLALPLTASVTYYLPIPNFNPMTLGWYGAYSPKPLSLMDADKYVESRLEVGAEIVETTHLFAGYRTIDTDYDKHNRIYNDSFYVGLQVAF